MSHYSTDEMRELFSDATTLEMWMWIERAHLQAQAAAGIIPQQWATEAYEAPIPDPMSWALAKERTQHEITAFLEVTGLPHIHIGLTSSDLVETTMALRLRKAEELILTEVERLSNTLLAMSDQYADLPHVARTHGQPAVIDSFGRKMRYYAQQFERISMWFPDLPGKLSGPVGSFTTRGVSPEMEWAALQMLHLVCEHPEHHQRVYCTQIVPREHLGLWVSVAVLLMGAFEGLATEIRLLSMTNEVQERHGADYDGSSAMPHKVNPIWSERVCGLSRLTRSSLTAILEGQAQWHERDLVHSSVERETLGRVCGYVAYSARLLGDIAAALDVRGPVMHTMANTLLPTMQTHEKMTDAQLAGVSYRDARVAAQEQAQQEQRERLVHLMQHGPAGLAGVEIEVRRYGNDADSVD